jgi:hypothetical protein
MDARVKLLFLFVAALVSWACRGRGDLATTTIAPADPRPAPTLTDRLGHSTAITTSGSPPPASSPLAPGTQLVTVRASGIEMRQLIPRGNTAFHIRNETPVRHVLVLEGEKGHGPLTLMPGGSAVLQAMLTESAYRLVCTTDGHRESVRFTTYRAGADLTRKGSPVP